MDIEVQCILHLCFAMDHSHMSWESNELESMFVFKLGRHVGVFA